MATSRRWRHVRASIFLIILAMILMRLVWMQLRSYKIIVTPRAYISLDMVESPLQELGIGISLGQNPTGISYHQKKLPPALAWFGTPAFKWAHVLNPDLEMLDDRYFIKGNQNLVMLTVFLAAVMTRFMTSSWTMAATVAAVLMSRGSLLGSIATVSFDRVISLIVVAFLTTSSHFLRSGSSIALVFGMLILLLGSFIEPSLAALGLAMPIFLGIGFLSRRRLARPVIKRLRGAQTRVIPFLTRTAHQENLLLDDGLGYVKKAKDALKLVLGLEFAGGEHQSGSRLKDTRVEYLGGGLLKTLRVPFLLWAYARRRWITLSIIWTIATVLCLVLSLGYKVETWGVDMAGMVSDNIATLVAIKSQNPWMSWIFKWSSWQLDSLDIHVVLSIGVIILCCLQSPASGVSGFFESAWLALISCLCLIMSAAFWDYSDELLRILSTSLIDGVVIDLDHRSPLIWIEPVIISIGVAGVYNLIKVIDTRWESPQKFTHRR